MIQYIYHFNYEDSMERIYENGKLVQIRPNELKIDIFKGKNVKIPNSLKIINNVSDSLKYDRCKIYIGDNVILGENIDILVREFFIASARLKIGSNTIIGDGSTIRLDNNRIGSNVKIGNSCTIGFNDVISNNVTIEDGCYLDSWVKVHPKALIKKNSFLDVRTVIEDSATINCKIYDDLATIGSFKRTYKIEKPGKLYSIYYNEYIEDVRVHIDNTITNKYEASYSGRRLTLIKDEYGSSIFDQILVVINNLAGDYKNTPHYKNIMDIL